MMSGVDKIEELGQRIEHRRLRDTARLSLLAKDSDWSPPCAPECTGWIRVEDSGDVLYGECPVYEQVPPCTIPAQRHEDTMWEMGQYGWPRKYADAEWEKCAAADLLTGWLTVQQRPGLMIHGPVGTGKSSALGLVARNRFQRDMPVQFVRWADMGDLLAYDNKDAMHRIRGARYLAIDDFGTVDHPSWVMARFDGLVEFRYSQKKPFLVSTNLTLQTLRKEPAWQRFVDRWGETMFVVAMPGKSMRS